MNEEIKKAFTLPFSNVYGVLGFIATVYGVVYFFESDIVKVLIFSGMGFIICIDIIIKLYLVALKLAKKNNALIKNNNGLIEAKDNYLQNNIALGIENDKLSEQIYYGSKENGEFREKLMYIMFHIQNLDIDKDDKKNIINYILGGIIDGKKELESYKDNK